ISTNERTSIIGTNGNAGNAPAEGLMIFNTTTKCFEAYVNGAWSIISCPVPCIPPDAPVADAATNISCTSFQANMLMSVAGVTSYCFDVATDEGFTTFVAGYNNRIVNNNTTCVVTGLSSNTTYYYRIRSFAVCYSANSNTITAITTSPLSSAPTTGTHTPSQTQIVWNWNTVSGATGYKWNTVNDYNTASDMSTSVTKTETGLTSNTTYTRYVWAYNSCGGSESTSLTQTTLFLCGNSFVDSRDSKTYTTVEIGSQCWMAQNLNYSTSGNYITAATEQTDNSIIEKHCYGDNGSNCTTNGGLYQWAEAVQYINGASNTAVYTTPPTGNVQGICPSGWHLPSDAEWTTLTTSLGGESVAGGTMKVTSICGTQPCWNSPNTGATNSSGFSAFSTGNSWGGFFYYSGQYCAWWTITESAASTAWYRYLSYNSSTLTRLGNNKPNGYSVRCIKD
ncbi:MAG: hypothetical protein HGB12_12860, partial [Bacteroidetes bacterium]|nr:hypothetical protein [Bacteroidota bacterium]